MPDEPKAPEPKLIGYILTPEEHAAVTTRLSRFPYFEIRGVMQLMEKLPLLHDNPTPALAEEVPSE